MSFISRGFRGRRRESDVDPSRVPPGQYVTDDFPVLSAGPTPHTSLEEWTFSITGEIDEPLHDEAGVWAAGAAIRADARGVRVHDCEV